MRARFIFGVLMVMVACKKHEPAPSLAPGSAAVATDSIVAHLGEHDGSVYPEQLVARDDGGFVVVVEILGKIKLADVEVVQTEEYHEPVVVVALDASGHVRWAHPFPTCSDHLRVAAHGTQTIVVGGCTRKLDAPGSDATPVDGFGHVEVAALDDKGTVVWAKEAGDPGVNTEARSVAVDADGTVYVGGELYGSADFGFGHIAVAKREQAGFVAAYAADGKPLWAQAYPNGDVEAVVLGGDEVDIAGGYKRTLTVGATSLASPAGGRFVARLAKANGEARGAAKVGENGSLYLALARAPSGMLYLSYEDPFENADGLASIDAANQVKVLHRFTNGTSMTFGTRSLAVDATGAVWLATEFDKQVDFGSGAIKATGNFDAVVAKYSADGALLSTTMPLATVTDESIDGLALTKAGPVVAMRSVAGPPNKPYSEWLVTETYGLTSLVRIAP